MLLQNAFVDRLGSVFQPAKMLVVDFMHEIELGVWKNLFTHLIRILYCNKEEDLVNELNERFAI